MDENYCILLNGGKKVQIHMKIKEAIEESKMSIEELSQKTGIEKEYLKTIQELPADEILLHEAILIANALDKKVVDLYEF